MDEPIDLNALIQNVEGFLSAHPQVPPVAGDGLDEQRETVIGELLPYADQMADTIAKALPGLTQGMSFPRHVLISRLALWLVSSGLYSEGELNLLVLNGILVGYVLRQLEQEGKLVIPGE